VLWAEVVCPEPEPPCAAEVMATRRTW
jgi:hypothetical protein